MALPHMLAALGLAAAVGAGGTAYAATSTGSTPPAQPAAPAAHARAAHPKARRTLLGRADYATFEVKMRGRWVTLELDRGKVTAVSPSSITLLRPDGHSVTEAITAHTRFAGVSGESQVQLHKPAGVLSEDGSALWIRQKPASA